MYRYHIDIIKVQSIDFSTVVVEVCEVNATNGTRLTYR